MNEQRKRRIPQACITGPFKWDITSKTFPAIDLAKLTDLANEDFSLVAVGLVEEKPNG